VRAYAIIHISQIERAITTCDSFSLRCGGNDTAIIAAHRVNARQFAEAFNFRENYFSLALLARSLRTGRRDSTYDPINFPNERKLVARQARARARACTLSVIVQRAERTVIYPRTRPG